MPIVPKANQLLHPFQIAQPGDTLLYQSCSVAFMVGTRLGNNTRLGRISAQGMDALEQAFQAGDTRLEIRCTPQK